MIYNMAVVLERALKESREEGLSEGLSQVVKNSIKLNLTLDEVVFLTGLSKEDVSRLLLL